MHGRLDYSKKTEVAGHVAQMDEELLFGWLPERRPAHGTKLRWSDRMRKDLRSFNIDEMTWYVTAQNRGNWRGKCAAGLEDAIERRFEKEEQRRARKLLLNLRQICP